LSPHPIAALAVVVPAHNEEHLLGECLRSILTALAQSALPSMIVLVAHNCTDRTEQIARRILHGRPALVLTDDSPTVATARHAGATAALTSLAAGGFGLERSWLLSTDADSVVPPSWIGDLRRHIDRGAAAVAGLVQVHDWHGASAGAREAYRAIVAAGIKLGHHEHVYGANLAVRTDAFLDVGGWPDRVPGEDTALVEALRARDWPVTSAADVWVRTSGRRTPRAAGGLGSLLERLMSEQQRVALDTGWTPGMNEMVRVRLIHNEVV
jgi:glycosyltransferase involved in cell wall biosynthesis